MGEAYKTKDNVMAVEMDSGVTHRFMFLHKDGIVVIPPSLWDDDEVRTALDENSNVDAVRNHDFAAYQTS